MRANWYIMMTTMFHDKMARRRGIVFVSDEIGVQLNSKLIKHIMKWMPMYNSFPGKVMSVHYCVNHTAMEDVAKFVLGAVPKTSRIRFRFHFGKFVRLAVETKPIRHYHVFLSF